MIESAVNSFIINTALVTFKRNNIFSLSNKNKTLTCGNSKETRHNVPSDIGQIQDSLIQTAGSHPILL